MIEYLYNENLYWAYIALAGFTTGLAYALGGSGGLIITPALITLGVPIHTAIGSAKLGSLAMLFSVFTKFKSSNKIRWDKTFHLTTIAVTGSIIGSLTTLSLSEGIIYPTAGLILIVIAPLTLINKTFGIESFAPTPSQKIIGYITFLCVMVFAGAFGAGAGILGIFVLVTFWGFTAFQAHASQTVPFLILNIVSASIFFWQGYVDLRISTILLITMTLGGWIGAHFAIKGGDKTVKLMSVAFGFLIGIKMLYESLL